MYHNYHNNVEVVNEITAPEPPEVSTREECFGANTTLQETILDFLLLMDVLYEVIVDGSTLSITGRLLLSNNNVLYLKQQLILTTDSLLEFLLTSIIEIETGSITALN